MPARFKNVVRALRRLEIDILQRQGGGSHCIVSDSKGHVYTLPLGNGYKTELSDHYLRGLCRAFEVDFQAFCDLL